MKKATFLLAAALMLSAALTSCQKEETNNQLVFHGTVENATKMEVDGTHLLWNYTSSDMALDYDYIHVYDLAGGYAEAYANRPSGVPTSQLTGPTADFLVFRQRGDASFNENADHYLALKGLKTVNEVATEYSAFADNVLCAPALSYKDRYFYPMPMIAYSTADDPYTFFFKNTSALLKITVADPDYNLQTNLLAINVSSNDKQVCEAFAYDINDGTIALRTPTAADLGMTGATEAQIQALLNSFNYALLGDINVSNTGTSRDYYIAVHPNTFNSFNIELQFDGGITITRRLSSGNTLTLARNTVTPITITIRDTDVDNDLGDWK